MSLRTPTAGKPGVNPVLFILVILSGLERPLLGIQHQSQGEGKGSPGWDISQWKISCKDLGLIPSIHQKGGREAEREKKAEGSINKMSKGPLNSHAFIFPTHTTTMFQKQKTMYQGQGVRPCGSSSAIRLGHLARILRNLKAPERSQG